MRRPFANVSLNMSGEETLVFCLRILRWSGLSFTKVRKSGKDLVAEDSKINLIINVIIAVGFLYLFTTVDPDAYAYTEKIYKTSGFVYPMYTKLMILTIVAFSVCGNIHNRKFVIMIRLFVRVVERLEREFGLLRRRKDKTGDKILFRFFLYILLMFGMSLWADAKLKVNNEKIFRFVHYFCFYYVTLFTAHFAVTMNFLRENFRFVNAAFGRIIHHRKAPSVLGEVVEKPRLVSRRLGVWMKAFLDLHDVERLANELFGMQIFLTFFLAFFSVVVNSYYFITLNLYETSSFWLNVTMWLGFVQSLIVAVLNTRAAELSASEANRINEIIFTFPVHLYNWEMYDQVQVFILFSHYYPIQFRVWVFYFLNYDSLVKAIISSSAITAIFLQCDFLKGNFER